MLTLQVSRCRLLALQSGAATTAPRSGTQDRELQSDQQTNVSNRNGITYMLLSDESGVADGITCPSLHDNSFRAKADYRPTS